MSTEILQVRDVPSKDVEVLRERASAKKVSLSGYLRELIREEASRPTMDEALSRIGSRDSVDVVSEDLRSYIEADRS